MKFEKTLLGRILALPKLQWEEDCIYIFVLKIPALICVMGIGIIGALVIDLIFASCTIKYD